VNADLMFPGLGEIGLFSYNRLL